MRVGEVLKEAEALCVAHGKEPHAARMLLMDRLNLQSYELFAAVDEELRDEVINEYFNTLNRYIIENEPIQYILGYAYFAGRDLFVDQHVLIPRPETEQLAYEVLLQLDELFSDVDVYPRINCADIGTGSGALAITLVADEPRVQMYATDISEEALVVARKNAESFAPDITFLVGDMLAPLIEQGITLDVLVSNPPYIPEEEAVSAIVADNEPHVALFGGKDGLNFYRVILEQAKRVLARDQYLLAFEIGHDQGERLVELARTAFPDATITVKKDMQGLDRMLFISHKRTSIV
jgi:release factor glutamine methyltransferase